MKELELMTSEKYWSNYLLHTILSVENHADAIWASNEIHQNVMKLIKLLKDEIPDYSTRFTH